jgi:hypothetical protein
MEVHDGQIASARSLGSEAEVREDCLRRELVTA